MAVKDRDIRKLMGDGTVVEADIQAKLDQQKRARIERCIKDVMPIMDRYGVTVEAQVVIQGNTIASQVIFRTKD